MHRPTRILQALAVTTLSLALLGCGGGDSDDAGTGPAPGGSSGAASADQAVKIDHSSPEKLFATMVDAAQAGDNAGVIAAYKPATQQELAAGMVAIVPTAAMIPGADKPGMLAVLKNHGIAESDLPALGPQMKAQCDELATSIKDKPAFIAAMMDKASGIGGSAGPGVAGMSAGLAGDAVKLADLETEGDRASALVTAAGQTGEKESRIYFVRVDGKWYIDGDRRD